MRCARRAATYVRSCGEPQRASQLPALGVELARGDITDPGEPAGRREGLRAA